ncbi:MAG: bifunctional methylenetetrahydrofolate dehydrogenase/methenyltetrahydrofolate cyclohydrolase FolD [Actinobacteria bacterium]|nr:bifunctional methylenetetrahydrofolate dehydrogenase/methenyltetrahydrofolate cyclohydrolase FolD [Actinomycetota bacterium]MCL5882811.1 bifunctional methylenetetrahydrofolate dehydrogenase/methenyltetrahydrofolate cyclohydrolase FolD [Actinomycetota bacterium]
MAEIIDGKKISADIRAEVAEDVRKMKEQYGLTPGLAVVLVGDDPGSQIYVNNKEKACAEVGFNSFKYVLPTETTQETLMALVDELNGREDVHGILVQMPLPKHLDPTPVLLAIDPNKDVDGFHPINLGRVVVGNAVLPSCTPAGCIELLERSNTQLEGANAVIVGRSNTVGKPVALLLLAKNCTVTICHSKTRDLPSVCRGADILIAAVGVDRMIKGDWVKDGVTVIDVGMNRTDEGLFGDVDFEAVKEKARAITPVPGGVGPMTIAMLMKNTLKAAELTL